LRLYAYTGTVDGPAVHSTGSSWIESGFGGITWSNRPARTSAAQDDKRRITTNSWVEFDVSDLVAGNGTYGFNLATTSTDGVDFRSREATSNRPELVLTVGYRLIQRSGLGQIAFFEVRLPCHTV
jgi:hypothetical protein